MPNQPHATTAAHERGHVRPADAERGAREHRKGNAVARARVCDEHHRHADDQISEHDREDGLLPVHARADEARRQHVGGDADREADPQRCHVVGCPRPLGDASWARGRRSRDGSRAGGSPARSRSPAARRIPGGAESVRARVSVGIQAIRCEYGAIRCGQGRVRSRRVRHVRAFRRPCAPAHRSHPVHRSHLTAPDRTVRPRAAPRRASRTRRGRRAP